MRWRDSLSLTLHSLSLHKARAALTTFVVWILGVTVMGLMLTGFCFSDNMRSSYRQWAIRTGIVLSQTVDGGASKSDLKAALEAVYTANAADEKNAPPFCVQSYADRIILCDFFCFDGTGLRLTSGDAPSTCVGTASVYLPEQENGKYAVGDEYVLSYASSDGRDARFTVRGFFVAATDGEEETVGESLYPIADLSYWNVNVAAIKNFYIVYDAERAALSADFDGDIERLDRIYATWEKIFPSKAAQTYTESETLDTLSKGRIISAVVVAVAFALSFVLLAMSVGSLSNSLMMSADQNRRFFALMRALGAEEKDVRRIVLTETFVVVATGLFASAVTLVFLLPTLGKITVKILECVLGYVYALTAADFTLTLVFPLWLPVVYTAAFTAGAALFARSGLKEIVSRSPAALAEE